MTGKQPSPATVAAAALAPWRDLGALFARATGYLRQLLEVTKGPPRRIPFSSPPQTIDQNVTDWQEFFAISMDGTGGHLLVYIVPNTDTFTIAQGDVFQVRIFGWTGGTRVILFEADVDYSNMNTAAARNKPLLYVLEEAYERISVETRIRTFDPVNPPVIQATLAISGAFYG